MNINNLNTSTSGTLVLQEDSWEAKAQQYLDENLQVIENMRANLVSGKTQENVALMQKFHSNIASVLQM